MDSFSMASQNPAAKAKVPLQINFTPKHKDSRHYLEERKESSLLNSSFQDREERPSYNVLWLCVSRGHVWL